ncbi:hypothetical protein [uncultured Modestobacter sp.]|uniref:hypothetical protein n=1 Tax=uncultured Modestobacter sp. TaxID=380048 RepID=UPI00262A93CA|nr:hypothetical protein [uncultured Modestobacter sp.]
MTENTGHTPHSEEPAEGKTDAEQPDSGRTPHPQEPAEGGAEEGTDPENRISEI